MSEVELLLQSGIEQESVCHDLGPKVNCNSGRTVLVTCESNPIQSVRGEKGTDGEGDREGSGGWVGGVPRCKNNGRE